MLKREKQVAMEVVRLLDGLTPLEISQVFTLARLYVDKYCPMNVLAAESLFEAMQTEEAKCA